MNTSKAGQVLNLINAEAERTVIAAMLDSLPLAVEIVEHVQADDFADVKHRLVFEAVRNLLHGIEAIDAPAVAAECKRLASEQRQAVKINDEWISAFEFSGDPIANMHTVKRLAWLRRAGDFAFWLAQELQMNPDPAALYFDAQEKWTMLQPPMPNQNFVYGWDTVGRHDLLIRERGEREDTGSPFDWPWSSWNAMIKPMRPGFVAVLAAADGVGKTTFLEMVAEHWCRTKHTVYVHLEDDLEYKLDRRMARQAQIDMDSVELGRFTAAEMELYEAARKRMADKFGMLHYYHAPGQSMAQIIRELEARVSEGVCDAVVFDYLDKVQPTRAQAKLFTDNTWERQANDMEQLKSFAEKHKLPIFTATQGNADMQDASKTQTRRNIQGSKQKSQKAQLVIILTRELLQAEARDVTGKVVAEKGEYSPLVKVRVDKQNRGRTGDFEQVIIGRYFTVRDKAQTIRTELN